MTGEDAMWLPAVERRGDIHFWFGKSLPYRRRLILAFALMGAGLALQVALLAGPLWVTGVPLTLAGAALLLAKGYRNTPDMTGPAEAWRSARRLEVERILEINRKQKSWDADAVDITNPRGMGGFLAVAGAFTLVTVIASNAESLFGGGLAGAQRLVIALGTNFAVMLAPFWFTGVRSILRNDKLVNKADLLLEVEKAFTRLKRDGEEFELQMQVAPTDGQTDRLPLDVKATIRFKDAPAAFLGLQMQISINSVQGRDFPYFYCVLVAKEEFGALRVGPPPKGIEVEPGHDAGVQVVVMRQATTKNAGYHTDPEAARRILAFALGEARRVLGAR
jgi:hypothetical protein